MDWKERRKRREGGFSLLEIFVALLILSLGILFLAMVQMTALTAKAPFSSSNPRTATELAQEAIDRLFQVPWGELRSSHPDGFQAGKEGVSPAFSRLAASSGRFRDRPGDDVLPCMASDAGSGDPQPENDHRVVLLAIREEFLAAGDARDAARGCGVLTR